MNVLIHYNPEVSNRRFDAVAALVELQEVPTRNAFSTVHEALSGVYINVLVKLDAKESMDDVIRDEFGAKHAHNGK